MDPRLLSRDRAPLEGRRSGLRAEEPARKALVRDVSRAAARRARRRSSLHAFDGILRARAQARLGQTQVGPARRQLLPPQLPQDGLCRLSCPRAAHRQRPGRGSLQDPRRRASQAQRHALVTARRPARPQPPSTRPLRPLARLLESLSRSTPPARVILRGNGPTPEPFGPFLRFARQGRGRILTSPFARIEAPASACARPGVRALASEPPTRREERSRQGQSVSARHAQAVGERDPAARS